jgi:hypothetical protein
MFLTSVGEMLNVKRKVRYVAGIQRVFAVHFIEATVIKANCLKG